MHVMAMGLCVLLLHLDRLLAAANISASCFPSVPDFECLDRPAYAVNEEPPTESEVLAYIQKMKNRKFGGHDGISAEMLKYLSLSGIREMTKTICSIWIDKLSSWPIYD
ncbi:hypothetical protein RB195_004035 [Necator americanus]|uniref:Uncharacterized protein n=1 Tax=Necator americanus TaxID=51031 RepID=A0ABR1BI37_NECAM